MKKILIIDDDIDIIESVKIPLEANNFEVVSETDSRKAFDAIKKHQPDLLILDVMFPESTTAGFDICREIKSREDMKKLPVIMLSAINEKFNMAFARKASGNNSIPADCFLEKPLNPQRLLKIINDLIV